MKIKLTEKPFWLKEYELSKAKEKLENDCEDAQNLYEALLTGANSIRLGIIDRKLVGYLDKDGSLALYGEYSDYTKEQLEKIGVIFNGLDTDNDGYTIAVFDKVGGRL